MKKTHVALILLIVGILLLCLSVIPAALSTAQKDVIGGADLPTFLFVFSREHGGLYSILALLGVAAVVTAVLMVAVLYMHSTHRKK